MSKIDTRLVMANVYPDRARITRRGEVSLETGLHSLEITNLPMSLNPDSARLSARDTARARLLGLLVAGVL